MELWTRIVHGSFLNPFLLTKTWEICYDGSWNQIKSNEVNVDENQEISLLWKRLWY